MEFVSLNNGIKMPRLGFGVFKVDRAQCTQVVIDALQCGYRLIDTASAYNNEEAVGAALKQAMAAGLTTREELFITTKAFVQEMGELKTREAFMRSLDKLGLEYLDLYLIHMPLSDYYGAWRALEKLYAEGLVRAVGVCNFDGARLLDLCHNTDLIPAVNQIERHVHYQRRSELQLMAKLKIQPEAWAPFAEGINGTFDDPLLKDIAAKYHKTTAQVMLRWSLQQGLVVIPKSVHKERMAENFALWDFELDAEDMQRIASLDTGRPSMLDCSLPSEIERLYNYLENPVLTSIN